MDKKCNGRYDFRAKIMQEIEDQLRQKDTMKVFHIEIKNEK